MPYRDISYFAGTEWEELEVASPFILATFSSPLYVSNDNRELELLWVRSSTATETVITGALYHPPKPCYQSADLYDHIERSLEEILVANDGASVILGGDFNQLRLPEVTARTGLIPLVNVPTRGAKTLDMIMSTPPARHNIKVVSSTVRSDHKAVLATTSVTHDRSKTSITKQFRRRTPSQHASLMNDLCSYDDSSLLAETDPEKAWNDFYATTSGWLDKYYPIRQVTITSREPPFMTPILSSSSGRRTVL